LLCFFTNIEIPSKHVYDIPPPFVVRWLSYKRAKRPDLQEDSLFMDNFVNDLR